MGMPYLRGPLALLLTAASLSLILRNAAVLVGQLSRDEAKRRRSLIPLIGGLLGSWAIQISPWDGLRSWAWAPLILDPGCAVLVMFFFVVVIRRPLKRQGDT